MNNGYTLADSTLLNRIKNQVREATKLVDILPIKEYPDTTETRQVKHEVSVLLSELQVHGLLPVDVVIVQESTLSASIDADREESDATSP